MTSSISTGALSGNSVTPTAVLACLPFTSPKTLINNSLAPFTTPGIAVKPGAQLTKPPNLTTFSI